MASQTTPFVNGLVNVPDSTQQTLGSLVFPDPTRCHTWMEDFDNYTSADWIVTTTGSGTVGTTNADGGIVVITNSAAASAAVFLQYSGNTSTTTTETWTFDTTKSLWFKARLKVSDATQSAFVIGLQATDTSPLSVSDGLFFIKADDAATMNFIMEASSSATTASNIATIANDTYFTCGFWWDPTIGQMTVYYNDAPVYTTSTTTNFPASSTTLTISWGLGNGEAVAKTLSLDYICVSKDRLGNTL